MFIRVRDSHMQSIIKAISWRIVGTVDTFVITLVITGNFVVAGSIASVESVSKIILYYLHERAWSKVALGRKGAEARGTVDGPIDTYPDATLAPGPVCQSLDHARRPAGKADAAIGVGFRSSSSCSV